MTDIPLVAICTTVGREDMSSINDHWLQQYFHVRGSRQEVVGEKLNANDDWEDQRGNMTQTVACPCGTRVNDGVVTLTDGPGQSLRKTE